MRNRAMCVCEGGAVYCPRCGKRNDVGARRCEACGNPLPKPLVPPALAEYLRQRHIAFAIVLVALVLAIVTIAAFI